MNEPRVCLNCPNPITMMCQQGTWFCSMNCHDEYVEYAGQVMAEYRLANA